MKDPSKSEEFQEKGKKKPSLREKIGKNALGWRLLVGFACVIFLAAFLHFREARIEVLELNSTASRFVVSQVDFEFPDEEATVILKQDAQRDIGEIYEIEEREIRDARFEFENFLIQNREWKAEMPSTTFEQLYKAADAFEDVLVQTRFTDLRTLQKMKEKDLPTTYYQVFVPTSLDEQSYLPGGIWNNIQNQIAQQDNFPSSTLEYVVDFFKKKKWSITEDFAAKSSIRQLVSKGVPEKYTRVKAGTRIIDQGEKVAARHLAMMQAMKKELNESRKLWEPLPILSSVLLALIIVSLSGFYFRMNQPDIVQSLQKLSLLVCIVVLTLIFAKAVEYVLLRNTTQMMDSLRYPLIVPFATILICILLNGRIALFASAFLAILLAATLAVDHSRFLVLNIIASLVVIICTKSLRKRKEVFLVCGNAFLSAVPVLFAYHFASNSFWSLPLADDIIGAFIFMTVIAILVVGLLPVLESIFRVMTDITLMEFMDPSNELLRRMTLEIPGTYQHCLVLGNLAEAMAQSIGADGLFCRVATLYHDIGKLNNPHFFTENQQGGVNIHQLLTPLESAQVIISHVKDGETLARKYRLPQSFIDIIREHHGTTLVYFFYCKQVELKGGNAKDVDEKQFRYPGPKPHSKESAIIMIADTVEAASRSLENVNEASLAELVNRMVRQRAEDGQFDECSLTFEELGLVKRTLVKTLLLTHHVRVKYPERKPGS